jgi:hypothetical protein
MGTYYAIVCDDLREFIDPGKIPNHGRKFNECVDGLSANATAFAMLTRWRGMRVRYVGDVGGEEGATYDATRAIDATEPPWTDVTESVLEEMKDE